MENIIDILLFLLSIGGFIFGLSLIFVDSFRKSLLKSLYGRYLWSSFTEKQRDTFFRFVMGPLTVLLFSFILFLYSQVYF